MTRAILHIGTHKTGSTYLQSWLVRNRHHLREQGIRTVSSIVQFHRLAAESIVDPARRAQQFVKRTLDVEIDDVLQVLRDDAGANSSDITVISSEFYWDMAPGDVRRTLDRFGISVEKIVCFVRRQDRLEASSHNQSVKALGLVDRYPVTPYWEGLDWNRLYDRWRDAFPEAALSFHGYDYHTARDLILTIFKQSIGCPKHFHGEILPARDNSNLSFDAGILEIARMANQREMFLLAPLLETMSGELFVGPVFEFDQATVSELERIYRPGNVLLARRLGSDDIIEIAQPGWRPSGEDLHGNVPVERMLDLLGRMEKRLVEADALKSKPSGPPRLEPFIQLNSMAAHNGVNAERLLAEAENELKGRQTNRVENAATVCAGASDGLAECALDVLNYAAVLLSLATTTVQKQHRTNEITRAESEPARPRELKVALLSAAQSLKRSTTLAGAMRKLRRGFPAGAGLRRRALFRLRNPYFDHKHYLASYPDLTSAAVDPFRHYEKYGRAEARNIAPFGHLGRLAPPIWSRNGLRFLGGRAEFDRRRETVLVVLHEGSRTGAPIIGFNLILALLKSYNVVVLVLHDGPVAQACRDAGAMVAVAHRRCRSWEEGGYFIRTLCREFRLKFAIVNSVEARFVLAGLKVEGVPVVTLIHEFASYVVPKQQFRYAVDLSCRSVVPAKIVLENALTAFPDFTGERFDVIPQGLCTLPPKNGGQAFETSDEVLSRMGLSGKPGNTIVVGGIGSVTFRKGVDLFIQCAFTVARANPDTNIHFVWVGDGYDPDRDGSYSAYIGDQLGRHGLSDQFTFAGEIQNMARVYEILDVFLLTSRLDPLPNVTLEALCAGLPLVCFGDTNGIVEFLSDSGLQEPCVAGYLDVGEMARKAEALILSRELRAEVGAIGKAAAERKFDSSRYSVQIEGLALEAAEMRPNLA